MPLLWRTMRLFQLAMPLLWRTMRLFQLAMPLLWLTMPLFRLAKINSRFFNLVQSKKLTLLLESLF